MYIETINQIRGFNELINTFTKQQASFNEKIAACEGNTLRAYIIFKNRYAEIKEFNNGILNFAEKLIRTVNKNDRIEYMKLSEDFTVKNLILRLPILKESMETVRNGMTNLFPIGGDIEKIAREHHDLYCQSIKSINDIIDFFES